MYRLSEEAASSISLPIEQASKLRILFVEGEVGLLLNHPTDCTVEINQSDIDNGTLVPVQENVRVSIPIHRDIDIENVFFEMKATKSAIKESNVMLTLNTADQSITVKALRSKQTTVEQNLSDVFEVLTSLNWQNIKNKPNVVFSNNIPYDSRNNITYIDSYGNESIRLKGSLSPTEQPIFNEANGKYYHHNMVVVVASFGDNLELKTFFNDKTTKHKLDSSINICSHTCDMIYEAIRQKYKTDIRFTVQSTTGLTRLITRRPADNIYTAVRKRYVPVRGTNQVIESADVASRLGYVLEDGEYINPYMVFKEREIPIKINKKAPIQELHRYHGRTRKDFSGDSIFKVGIEIEKIDPIIRKYLPIEEMYQKYGIVCEFDRSLTNNGEDIGGFEMVSGILPLDVTMISNLFRSVSHFVDADADDRCGGHIHVSEKGKNPSVLFNELEQYIPLLFALYPDRSYKRYSGKFKRGDMLNNNHSTGINLTRYTVEFRMFPAVKNTEQLINRVKLIEYILKNKGATAEQIKNSLKSGELYKMLRQYMSEKTLTAIIATFETFSKQYNS